MEFWSGILKPLPYRLLAAGVDMEASGMIPLFFLWKLAGSSLFSVLASRGSRLSIPLTLKIHDLHSQKSRGFFDLFPLSLQTFLRLFL